MSRYHSICLLLLAIAMGGHAQPVNLARFQSTAADSVWGNAKAAYATDGIVGNDNRWVSDGPGPHWLEVGFPVAFDFGSAHVYLGKDDAFAVDTFWLQYWSGSAWISVPGGSTTGNTAVELNLVFSQTVTASRIRFYTTDATARIKELALFPPNPGGYPLGTGVTVNLARQRLATGSSTYANNHPLRAVDGFVDDTSRWVSANVNGPHIFEIDLSSQTKIGSAHVWSGYGVQAGSGVSDFDLYYWGGSAWSQIPGASVSGNTALGRVIDFTSEVTTDKVRLVVHDNGHARVKELLIFPANGGTGYPLGTNVFIGPRPTTKFEDYSDSFYSLQNRVTGNVPESVAGAVTVVPSTGSEEQQYQLLLNLGTETYRMRNRRSGQTLQVAAASRAPGAAVVESTYEALPHQTWRLQATTGGYRRIVNAWSGMALDVDLSGPAPALVQQPIATASAAQEWDPVQVARYPKKGLAGWEGRAAAVGASWTYNWGLGTGTTLGIDTNFAPMRWGNYGWGTMPSKFPQWHTREKPPFLMGFNEPDSGSQANIGVNTAVDLWPRLMAANEPLVSPATVNPYNGWMSSFMNQCGNRGYRNDYVGVHWYSSPSPDGFMNFLSGVHNAYNRKLWITEFSNVDWSGNGNWDYLDNYSFWSEILWRMENTSWIKRYSIFVFTGSATSKRSNFYLPGNQVLTPIGELYSGWDGDTTIRNKKPYFIYNKAAQKHVSLTAAGVGTATIFTTDESVQWFLLQGSTPWRWYVVSPKDGRRLYSNGSTVGLAPAGTVGPTVEWKYVPSGQGWFHLDDMSANRRLRLNGTSFELVNQSTSWDSTKFRFIKPLASTPTMEHYGTSCGSGRIGWSWNQAAGAFQVKLTNAIPSSPAYLAYSLAQANAPLDAFGMTGCVAHVSLSAPAHLGTIPVMTNVNGDVNFSLPVPPGFSGHVFFQWAFSEPGLNPAGLGVTRALHVIKR